MGIETPKFESEEEADIKAENTESAKTEGEISAEERITKRKEKREAPLRRKIGAILLAGSSVLSSCMQEGSESGERGETIPNTTTTTQVIPESTPTTMIEVEPESTTTTTVESITISIPWTGPVPPEYTPPEHLESYSVGVYTPPTTVPSSEYVIPEPDKDTCTTLNPSIREEIVGSANLIDEKVRELEGIEYSTLESLGESLQWFEDLYGVDLVLNETERTRSSLFSTYSLEKFDNTHEDIEIAEQGALAMLRGLRHIPPELFKIAELDGILLVKEIVEENIIGGAGGRAAGYYHGDWVVLSAEYGERSVSTMSHEWGHAFDFAVCGWDVLDDIAYTRHNGDIEYSRSGYDEIDKKYISPGKDRVFASGYGSSSVMEDRATMMSELFFTRGIVQPNDPDWGSLYHYKQLELMSRITEMNPDLEQYLIGVTEQIRSQPNFDFRIRPYREPVEGVVSSGELEKIQVELRKRIEEREPTPFISGALVTFSEPGSNRGRVIWNPIVEPRGEGQDPGHLGTYSWWNWWDLDRDADWEPHLWSGFISTFPFDPRDFSRVGSGEYTYNEAELVGSPPDGFTFPRGFEGAEALFTRDGIMVGASVWVDDIETFLIENGYN